MARVGGKEWEGRKGEEKRKNEVPNNTYEYATSNKWHVHLAAGIPPVASKSSTMNTRSEGENAPSWHCTVLYRRDEKRMREERTRRNNYYFSILYIVYNTVYSVYIENSSNSTSRMHMHVHMPCRIRARSWLKYICRAVCPPSARRRTARRAPAPPTARKRSRDSREPRWPSPTRAHSLLYMSYTVLYSSYELTHLFSIIVNIISRNVLVLSTVFSRVLSTHLNVQSSAYSEQYVPPVAFV